MLLAAVSISGALSLVETKASAPLEEATRRTQWLGGLFETHALDLQQRQRDLLAHLSRDPELSTALRTSKRRRPPLEPILHRLVSPYNRGAWLLLDEDNAPLAKSNTTEALTQALVEAPFDPDAPKVAYHDNHWLLSVPIQAEDELLGRLSYAYPIPFEALEGFSQRFIGEFKWIFFTDNTPHLEALKGLEIPNADPYPTEIQLDGVTQAIWRYPLEEIVGLEVGLLTPALPFHDEVKTHPLALLKAARGDLRRTIALIGLFLAAWILLIAWSERKLREPIARLSNAIKANQPPQTDGYPVWLHPLVRSLIYAEKKRGGRPITMPTEDIPSEPPRVPTEMMGSLPSRGRVVDEDARTTAPSPALEEGRDTEVVEALDGDLEERFQAIFQQFMDTKTDCGESTHSLDFLKFRSRLINTRNSLMERFECVDVRFRVYVKDNKAALKAAPILQEDLEDSEG